MRNLYIILLSVFVVTLSATSLIIDRGEDARIVVETDTIDSLYFSDTVYSEEVAQIHFVVDDTDPYHGDELIMVELMDANGNLVLDSPPVTLSFAYTPPGGANINNEVYTIEDSITVATYNGIALAVLHWGYEAGYAVIRASVESNGQMISNTQGYVVYASEVESIDIQMGTSAIDCGNGFWSVPIAAMCLTVDGNTPPYGTAVWFTIDDETIEWCNVVAESYTGNHNVYGDSTQGVANTLLTYDGSHSLEEVPVHVECGNLSVVEYIQLPIQLPQLEIYPMPGHLDWTNNNFPSPLVGEIFAQVSDAQGNPIANAVIIFYSERGEFIEPDEQYQVPGEDWYVLQTNEWGNARALIQYQTYECPPVIPPPNEIPVDIHATILGTEVTDQTTVILLNYYTD